VIVKAIRKKTIIQPETAKIKSLSNSFSQPPFQNPFQEKFFD